MKDRLADDPSKALRQLTAEGIDRVAFDYSVAAIENWPTNLLATGAESPREPN
jgi:hypothetical protein